ncbi:MAG: hypothetical protein DSM107014_07665 [Gomphosphaeria aponina SAG 52.96 = DSM 107014]|uniref:Immunity protein Imm5 domain-containing protein n=1 Tax=Gomphosphaeria aponina SAG 52.96 = DSM 107014 TaxID=1521640 RepID=A0A941JUX4_9CHRO|nr:hypothetical protein [Gomphosphaeria aponina SAG 52.96 = DSM 107014]
MLIPAILHQKIETAKAAMYNHPHHDLNLGYRQDIWAALGLNMDGAEVSYTVPRKRRAMLAILAATRVIPVWEGIWSIDYTPHCILGAARLVLNGTLEVNKARSYRDDNWGKLESLATFPQYQSSAYQKAISAGLSAISALGAALDDEQFDKDQINYDLTDADVDAYYNDSSFWAANAIAGAIWEPNSDAIKRRSFWEWWLSKAVTNAWWAFTDNSRAETFPRQMELIA